MKNKNWLIIKYIKFLISSPFGKGYAIAAIILPILFFGISSKTIGLISGLLLFGFFIFILISKAKEIKEFIDYKE